MKVDFNNRDMIHVYAARVTGGNISTKAFHGLIDKIKGVKNVPTPINQAVQKKAEKHPHLQALLLSAYNHRTDAQHAAEIAKQQDILKNNNITQGDYIKQAFCIAKKMVDQSGEEFRLQVTANLPNKKDDHSTTSEIYNKLNTAQQRLKESVESLKKIKEQIQLETSIFRPEERGKCDSYIKQYFGEELTRYNNSIAKQTAKVATLTSELSKQRGNFAATVIDQAEKSPSLINKKMQPHLTELKKLKEHYNASPRIRMDAESKIEELTKQREENKNKAVDIKNTAVKDEVIKLPDVQTHKAQSPLTDKIKNTAAAG